MPIRLSILLIFLPLLLSIGCKEEPIYHPKPRMYPKVEYPERRLVKLDTSICQFSFQYPDYMQFVPDTQRFTNAPIAPNACWFNMTAPAFNGDIHFTYTDISANTAEERAEKVHRVYRDAYKMADEHDRKAVMNEDLLINRPDRRVYGILYNIEGHVASSFQFVITDSMRHALRASLYFRSIPNPDSMMPVIEFVKQDIMTMLNTFEWK